VEDHCATRERFTFQTCVRSWAEEDRPRTAVNFKHGNSTGPDAGKKIKEGIRAKACTYVRTSLCIGCTYVQASGCAYVRTCLRTRVVSEGWQVVPQPSRVRGIGVYVRTYLNVIGPP